MPTFALEANEFKRRLDVIRAELAQRHLDALVVFAAQRVLYLSGFAHVPTERPVALIVPVNGEPAIIIPALEQEHLDARAGWIRRRRVYFEYPGTKHPMRHLAELLEEIGLAHQTLAADIDGYGNHMGYRGPSLSDVTGKPITIVRDLLDDLRLVKSAAEIELLRAAGHWATVTHHLLQEEMTTGQSEIDISQRAQRRAAEGLADVLADQGYLGGAATVSASFRSGARTAMPHAMMGNRPIGRGDNLVSYCLGITAGYHAELERTMFLGEPSARQRELIEIVQEAQQLAFATIRPGVRCAEVEERVHNFLVERGGGEFIRHHTGHGLGLEAHEPPFFDLGDNTVLRPGMVFSVEPGLYVPGLGGFRHSDTVALTESGPQVLTEYPRAVQDLVIAV